MMRWPPSALALSHDLRDSTKYVCGQLMSVTLLSKSTPVIQDGATIHFRNELHQKPKFNIEFIDIYGYYIKQ